MSAVPKKKLCWNCEGNVAKDIDNCPYCGVYLHAAELEEASPWNPSYRPSADEEDIPSPLYQIKPQVEEDSEEAEATNDSKSMSWDHLFSQLKHDVFPILFLMMGSVFFLFGIVLLLFSQNGTFTLQWKESDGLYFLLFAVPLIGFGWMYFQRLEANE
jgi:hypothetical protein